MEKESKNTNLILYVALAVIVISVIVTSVFYMSKNKKRENDTVNSVKSINMPSSEQDEINSSNHTL